MLGRVILVNYEKGFGFISSQLGDVFFHVKDLQNARFDNINTSSVVTYVLLYGDKGLYAKDVYQQK